MDLLGQLLPRRFEAEIELAGEGAEDLHVIRAGRVGARPGHDRALLDAEILVGDDQVRIEELLLAEPVAARAGALRRVEAEQARLDLRDGEAADRAGELLGEDDPALGGVGGEDRALVRFLQRRRDADILRAGGRGGRIGRVEIDRAVGELQRLFQAVRQAGLDAPLPILGCRTTRRSTTTSRSCLYFLSRAGASSIS